MTSPERPVREATAPLLNPSHRCLSSCPSTRRAARAGAFGLGLLGKPSVQALIGDARGGPDTAPAAARARGQRSRHWRSVPAPGRQVCQLGGRRCSDAWPTRAVGRLGRQRASVSFRAPKSRSGSGAAAMPGPGELGRASGWRALSSQAAISAGSNLMNLRHSGRAPSSRRPGGGRGAGSPRGARRAGRW